MYWMLLLYSIFLPNMGGLLTPEFPFHASGLSLSAIYDI
jgi:hypothetical protein